MKVSIAVLDKQGEEAPAAAIAGLKSFQKEKKMCFALASTSAVLMEKDISSLERNNLHSHSAIGCAFSETFPQNEPQFSIRENRALLFEGRIYSPAFRPPSPFADRVFKNHHGESEEAIKALVEKGEGDFSITVAEPTRILAGRDPVGVKPLYFGENDAYFALGSNRRVLWNLGIEKTSSFPPGHIAVVSREGFKFKPVRTLRYVKPKSTTMEDAARTLQRLLERSVRLRVRGLKEVAVAFSGGLDSSIVASVAKKQGVNVHLLHVSLRNQAETEEAKKAAEELQLPLSVHLFREEDVAKVVAKVVELIEEPDPLKAAVGIPFYWTAEKTAEAGFKVLLAGQGADELFGGYQRYVNEYLAHGEEKVRKTMFADLTNIHESNIERDEKICGFHDVELRLPFASYPIAKFAISLPLALKIDHREDSLRKLVLRKVAENMGLPASITKKRKKAVQYATGVNDVLKKLAKEQKATVAEFVSKFFSGKTA